MIIKNPRPADTQQMKFLWKYCFGDSDSFISYLFENYYKPEGSLAFYDGDTIASCLQFFPYQMSWSGKDIKAAYIAGVCTAPEYRRRGLVSRLFEQTMQTLREQGYDAAVLIPFRFDFYNKMGFKCISSLVTYEGDMRELSSFSLPYRPSGDRLRIYNDFVRGKSIYIKRDNKAFADIDGDVKNEGGYFFACEDAYLYYYLQGDTFYAPEMVYRDINGLYKLLTFIKSHSSQVSKFRLRGDISAFEVLCETAIEVKIKPHVMAYLFDKGLEMGNKPKHYINMIGWV